MLYGVSMSSALAAGVIMAALPAVVAILSRLLLGERVTPSVRLGIACAVGGIALVSFSRHAGAERTPVRSALGNLLLFGAVCCEATYVVIGKRLTTSLGPKRISALINLWGLVLVAPLGLWQALQFDFSRGRPVIVGVPRRLLHCRERDHGVALDDRAQACRRRSRRNLHGAPADQPPPSVGVAFLGERFDAAQAGAFALALAGIVLATWPSRAAVG